MPATRTAAQAEAARRNGRHSRGPATPEGKARASCNAPAWPRRRPPPPPRRRGPRHLRAAPHRPGPGPAPATELAAQLVRRLAATLWKQERADRLETEILADQPKHDLAYAADHHTLVVNPAATIQLARFNALRAYQAQLGRRHPPPARAAAAQAGGDRGERTRAHGPEPAGEPVPPNEPEPPADALQAAAMIATGEPLQILAAARFLGMEEEVTAYFERQEAANTDCPPWPAAG